jgi:hypothetical protein
VSLNYGTSITESWQYSLGGFILGCFVIAVLGFIVIIDFSAGTGTGISTLIIVGIILGLLSWWASKEEEKKREAEIELQGNVNQQIRKKWSK